MPTGGGGIIFEIIRKEEKCMKKLMILGLMLSLFTFMGNNEEIKTTYAAEVTPVPGTYVDVVGDDLLGHLENTSYNKNIISIKLSNKNSDLPLQENMVCDPIIVTNCLAYDINDNSLDDVKTQAYLSYAADSTTENPRYDCLIYTNVETIYAQSSVQFMFKGTNNTIFPEVIDVSMLNTSNVTSMSCMFFSCPTLKTIIGLENFDTSNVTDMNCMFAGCESLTELNLSRFDTSLVTNMSCMFEHCKKLVKVDVSNFNTSKVRDVSYMFDDCPLLKKLDLSNWNLRICFNKLMSIINTCTSLEFIKMPNKLPKDYTQESNTIELPSQLAEYYGITRISSENLEQYKAFCIPGDEYAKKWRALRAENGDSICSLLTPGTEGNTKLTQLLAEHDAMDKNYQEYLYLVTDKENVTVGESIAYVKNVLEGKQGTDGNYGLTDENNGSFMTMSITEESPYLIAIIALLGIFAVLGYYFYNKKKHAN